MKKLFFIAILMIGTALSSQAQEISENALGLRLGGGNGFGAEVSYQRALGDNNRLELDLGWRNSNKQYDAYKLVGLYQWVWNLEGGFNWYAGAGGGIGSITDNRVFNNGFEPNDGTYILVAGNIGIEYNFDFPLLLSLDFRPEFGFNDYNVVNQFSPDVALGVRYQF